MSTDIHSALRGFILSTFLFDEPPETLQNSTPLISSGIIESLAVADLATFIQRQFDVKLEEADLSVERMNTIDMIAELVRERRGS